MPGAAEPPVARAGRDEHRARRRAPSRPRASSTRRSPSARSDVHPRAKTYFAPNSHACWYARCGELGAADPAREAEVVADERAGARLSSDRLALDDHGAQPLGRGVHRRREPGRTGADDREIALRVLVEVALAERVAELAPGRRDERATVEEDHDRQTRAVRCPSPRASVALVGTTPRRSRRGCRCARGAPRARARVASAPRRRRGRAPAAAGTRGSTRRGTR